MDALSGDEILAWLEANGAHVHCDTSNGWEARTYAIWIEPVGPWAKGKTIREAVQQRLAFERQRAAERLRRRSMVQAQGEF